MTKEAEYCILSKCEKYEKCDWSGTMPGGKHILGKQNPQRVFGTAKVGDRGQIVIPKEARELFGIRPGDTLLIVGEADTGLIVSRPEILNELATELLNNVKKEDI